MLFPHRYRSPISSPKIFSVRHFWSTAHLLWKFCLTANPHSIVPSEKMSRFQLAKLSFAHKLPLEALPINRKVSRGVVNFCQLLYYVVPQTVIAISYFRNIISLQCAPYQMTNRKNTAPLRNSTTYAFNRDFIAEFLNTASSSKQTVLIFSDCAATTDVQQFATRKQFVEILEAPHCEKSAPGSSLEVSFFGWSHCQDIGAILCENVIFFVFFYWIENLNLLFWMF